MDAIAYDEHYTGPAFDPAEGQRLAKIIGNKTVLFMANHGVTTLGMTVAEAYNRLYYLERAAQVQIYAMWTGSRSSNCGPPWSRRPGANSAARNSTVLQVRRSGTSMR